MKLQINQQIKLIKRNKIVDKLAKEITKEFSKIRDRNKYFKEQDSPSKGGANRNSNSVEKYKF